mgnify:FL=1
MMKEPQIGVEFNKIINKDVLREISNATTSLNRDLIYVYPDDAKELIVSFMNEAKRVINCYLDEQENTLLKLSLLITKDSA